MKVAIHGAAGRMGQNIAAVIEADPNAELVAAMDCPESQLIGQDIAELAGAEPRGVRITADVEEFLANVEVVIDFSVASDRKSVV